MEKELIKSEIKSSVKIIPIFLFAISIVLIIIGFDNGSFGYGGAEYYCMFIGGIIAIIVAIVMLLYISKCQMVVTDKRVYGKASFGKVVDLPMDSISAVGMAWLDSITVSTSSGAISFVGMANKEELYRTISNIISNRNTRIVNIPETKVEENRNSKIDIEELKKLKELLDDGILTQEEFETKKKELLK